MIFKVVSIIIDFTNFSFFSFEFVAQIHRQTFHRVKQLQNFRQSRKIQHSHRIVMVS